MMSDIQPCHAERILVIAWHVAALCTSYAAQPEAKQNHPLFGNREGGIETSLDILRTKLTPVAKGHQIQQLLKSISISKTDVATDTRTG
jgi:hypothetical protein